MNPGFIPVGPNPTTTVCPSCRATITSRVERVSNSRTHVWAVCLFLWCCPLFWLPYCMDSCQDATHYCPNCNAYLGAYKD